MRLTIMMLASLIVLGAIGCVEDVQAPLYKANSLGGGTTTISGISSPSGVYLAGVTSATITGTNFSTVPSAEYVFFDTARAVVLQASATQLVVQVPYFPILKDSIRRTLVRVASQSSPRYDTTYLSLSSALASVGRIGTNEEVMGVATDAAGNLYAGVYQDGKTGQIIRVSAATNGRDTITAPVATRKYIAMKVGPGGYLYLIGENINAMLRVTTTPGAVGVYGAVAGMTDLSDFDFDSNLNIWIGSKNAAGTKIARMLPSKTLRTFSVVTAPSTMLTRAVRVYNGYLYLGGKRDTLEGVWRAPIVSADSLGLWENVLDIKAATGVTCQVRSLTFASDGTMYIGTDATNGIYTVASGSATAQPLYAPVIGSPIHALAWGNGPALFASKRATPPKGDLYYINTEKSSAPYYGR